MMGKKTFKISVFQYVSDSPNIYHLHKSLLSPEHDLDMINKANERVNHSHRKSHSAARPTPKPSLPVYVIGEHFEAEKLSQ